MSVRLITTVMRTQFRMTRHNVEDLFPILTLPLTAVVAVAVFQYSERGDLVGYALVAALLMSIGQMSFFVGSEILANEREGQTLELAISSPTAYYVPLLTRVAVLSSVGILGLVEAWAVVWLVFGVTITVYHPGVAMATLILTVFAGSATALITSTIFCFGKTTRTYQNAISGPLYLLGGVLVPVAYLPEIVQPLSRFVFLFWSADLLRDALQPQPPENVAGRLAAILALGIAGGGVGAFLFGRLLGHLRREGTLGI